MHVRLPPPGPRLEPEDGGDHRLAAFAGGLAEQVLGHLGVGLDVPAVEFLPVVLAQSLGVDADHTCDVEFGDAVSRHRLHLLAIAGVRLVRRPAHAPCLWSESMSFGDAVSPASPWCWEARKCSSSRARWPSSS